ncbi:MAG: PH domain-containing protein [Bdellovibrionales bacterium]|nr:PH domain-containing protein [Bdellovibrionales bacterium]
MEELKIRAPSDHRYVQRDRKPVLFSSISDDVVVRPSLVNLLISALPTLTILTVALVLGEELIISKKWQPYIRSMTHLAQILILIGLIRRYFDDLYVLHRRGMIRFKGRVSLQYGVTHIRYANIRELAIEQNLLGRMLDYGTIKVGTAATDHYELVLTQVPSPHFLHALINERRRKKRK